ncbi:MAG TPA: FkbM family methyltransferase [Thermoleophilaceae bacterium]|nr:FkbM family methyltransferase [Thermoleophilaceae bacterium]
MHLPDPVVVVDAGVRWGFAGEWDQLGEAVRLIGFEPDPDESRTLTANLADRPNAEIVASALGSEPGRAVLNRAEHVGGSSLLATNAPSHLDVGVSLDLVDRVEVPVTTLDLWLAEAQVERVDAFKLDTQGYEGPVLEGAGNALATVRVVEIEVSMNVPYSGFTSFADVDRLLRSHGLVLWRLPLLAHYPLRGGEDAPLQPETLEYGPSGIRIAAPPGQLSWADAIYVAPALLGVDDERAWDVALRDAILANAHEQHDLAQVGLRRVLEADPPDRLRAAVDRVLSGPDLPSPGSPAAKRAGAAPKGDELARAVEAVPFWWHSIDLGGGIVTPGRKSPEVLESQWRDLQLDVSGRTLLDVGAWDGWFSFRAEREGAERVVALDHFAWMIDPTVRAAHEGRRLGTGPLPDWDEVPGAWQPDVLPGRRGYELAHLALGSSVENAVADIATLDPSDLGTFDIVLCLGVIYHVRDPLGVLRNVAALTAGTALIETEAVFIRDHEEVPMFEFAPSDSLGLDRTNWYVPNANAALALCREAGFSAAELLVGPEAVSLPRRGEPTHYRAVIRATR